jgi:hypothetical protein
MNKQDKQFGEMMKGMKIESPSSDFMFKVMSRVYAEAAVQRKPLLQNYQPVISKRAWIILIVAFVALMIYITVSGQPATPAGGTGFWSTVSEKMGSLQTSEASSILKTGTGLFTSIPTIAYLILIAALALWTLDGFLNKLRHQHTDLQSN